MQDPSWNSHSKLNCIAACIQVRIAVDACNQYALLLSFGHGASQPLASQPLASQPPTSSSRTVLAMQANRKYSSYMAVLAYALKIG